MDDVLAALLAPVSRLTLTAEVGIDQLVRAAKKAYVETAIEKLFPVDSRINISRLSVATGLTRKEVALLVVKPEGRKGYRTPRIKEQRAMRVLRGWRTDTRFHRRGGGPAQLPMRGAGRAFSALVKLYGGDVTPISVLRELERMGAVSVTRTGLLRMRAPNGLLGSHASQHLLEMARLLSDFTDTLAQPPSPNDVPAFFGFRDCTVASFDDSALFQRTFSKRAAALLESFDQWRGSRGEARKALKNGARVGIGVYLVNRDGLKPIDTPKSLPRARIRRTAK